MNNIVVFDNFGSDMRSMCKVFKETRGATPTFDHVVLRLGDDADALLGMVKIDSFASVLAHLRTPLKVKKLTIILELFSFEAEDQLKGFAAALYNIKVSDRLEIYGCEFHLKYGVREFSKALQMNIVPVNTTLECSVPAANRYPFTMRYSTDRYPFIMRQFTGVYARATNTQQLYEQPGQVIDDATTRYRAWMDAIDLAWKDAADSAATNTAGS